MEYAVKDLSHDMSVFNDEMDGIDKDNEKAIIDFCMKVEHYLYEHGLVCRRYQLYQRDWEQFENALNRQAVEKSLYELFVYLFIYSREEHMSGGYGGSYIRAFQNGAIPDIIRELTRRLERMADTQNGVSDKNGSIGIAGEYFVVAELTRRGYVASLTSKNTKTVDILASDKTGNKVVAIQVKTCDNSQYKRWKMGNNAEINYAQNLYYVFVNMNGGSEPSYYIVPSAYVAYRIKIDYEEWLKTPGKHGQKHNPTTMRIFEFVDEEESIQYQDAWYLLGI